MSFEHPWDDPRDPGNQWSDLHPTRDDRVDPDDFVMRVDYARELDFQDRQLRDPERWTLAPAPAPMPHNPPPALRPWQPPAVRHTPAPLPRRRPHQPRLDPPPESHSNWSYVALLVAFGMMGAFLVVIILT